MSRLNPNAGEFVPSFGPAIAATAAPAASSSALSSAFSSQPSASSLSPASASLSGAATGGAPEYADVVSGAATPAKHEALSAGEDAAEESLDPATLFKSLCDITLPGIPDIVRAPPPVKKLGAVVKGRIVYSVQDMLQFQSLYTKMPVDIAWSEILVSGAETDKKSKAQQAKANKQKEKSKRQLQMQYDPSLVCYFNPTEYAAAMGLYTGPEPSASGGADGAGGGAGGDAAGGKAGAAVPAVNPIEEAVIAKRRLATLLDDVGPETIASILESFQEIAITCTHTLQEVIGLLFDHAIADPLLCDSYAQLCSGISEKTPEFKEGAKTINFRRILLTRCYEALVEEPEVPQQQQQHVRNGKVNGTAAGASSPQHSWRRRCMLRNVRFIGELFRRQLLTENVMHVCVAMMLDDEVKPQAEIIEAACELIALVGDLLDGSSPASRRTMDEYFTVLNRLHDNSHLPASVKNAITEMTTLRTSGWAKKRADAAQSPAKAAVAAVQVVAAIPVEETPAPADAATAVASPTVEEAPSVAAPETPVVATAPADEPVLAPAPAPIAADVAVAETVAETVVDAAPVSIAPAGGAAATSASC